MLDHLYLNKLKDRIPDSDYDKYYIRLREQLAELQDNQDNYHITAQYVINLTNKAYELFKSSEVKKKTTYQTSTIEPTTQRQKTYLQSTKTI
tara:strand:+ start:926 stop:1201 length:276 start_codon:yes stop_codon:yes gene_type:complete